ncbi:MAG: response regulator [Sediminibacterium sp.]|nr:response regulator [Sediminibacterium sp.]
MPTIFHITYWHDIAYSNNMKRKVLIIDDETDECLLISAFLSRKNYEVKCAHTLGEGFEKLKTEQPDALLLDNNLPDGLGWSRAEEIRKQFPLIQITLISANGASAYPVTANGSGFDKLEKPISFQTLENYLR